MAHWQVQPSIAVLQQVGRSSSLLVHTFTAQGSQLTRQPGSIVCRVHIHEKGECPGWCSASPTLALSGPLSWLQSGQLTPIDLIVEEHFHRAAPGGMGGTKAAGNYSPVLVTQLEAKRNNYAGLYWIIVPISL